jgi:hypothetical protein
MPLSLYYMIHVLYFRLLILERKDFMIHWKKHEEHIIDCGDWGV